MGLGILEIVSALLVPLIKWIFEKIAKKKLNDKEFVEYISAHQKKRGQAGQAAVSWEEALAKAKAEMKQSGETKDGE